MKEVSLGGMKQICFFYGGYNLILQSLQITRESQRPPFWIISTGTFFSVVIFTFIMLRFKEELNNRLGSFKMDIIINLMICITIAGHGGMILAKVYPSELFWFQLIFAVTDLVLLVIYSIFLKRLDAPIELIGKLKDLPLYSNCILTAVLMAISLIGIVISIFLISLSYFILGGIFADMEEIR
ncbi:hypothetical protein [Ilyobacter sp.]|jgi:hypothetical protein|uniref:hypothetical protein n=1 Tax=Ilyobacter sp. TaxID=3100343 RepID=UPI00356792A6